MADFLHDLPLSWRPRRDESDVTGDWRDAVAEVIDVAATQLDAAEVGETTSEWLATDFLRAASSRRLMFADRHPFAGGPDHRAAYLEDADGYEVELVAY